jgi:hypothetical protein
MTGFTVDPERLAAAGQSLQTVGESLGSALTQVQTTLTSNSPWGADEAGTVFGMAYTALLSHALEAMGSHAGAVHDGAHGLGAMAAIYDGFEKNLKSGFDAMGDGAAGAMGGAAGAMGGGAGAPGTV